jgi:hypothetical protein
LLALVAPGIGEVEQPRERLDGFAETHVVGEDAAEAEGGEMGEEMESFLLIRSQGGAQAGGERGRRERGEGGDAAAEGGGEGSVAGLEEIGFRGKLERVDPVRRGATVGEYVGGVEAESGEGGGGGGVGLVGDDLEALPAVAREADPFAAGFHEQGDFVSGKFTIFDAEFDGEIEPVLAGALGVCGGKFNMRTQGRAEEIGEARRSFDAEAGRERGMPSDKFFGKRLGDRARPITGPILPNEGEIGEAHRGGLGEAEIEFEQRVGGAAKGGFAHDTGEGAISPYHLKHGGDLIWEIGSGYFGCRTADGHFDAEKFREKANLPTVKAISIKLSQGAKPGLGGVLPGPKVTPEIGYAISEIGFDAQGRVKVKFHDKVQANRIIHEHLAPPKPQRVRVEGADGGPVAVIDGLAWPSCSATRRPPT